MPIKQTLEAKMRYRIKRSKDKAFVIKDFLDLSDRDQVGRVLRKMVRNQELLKIGQGIYAKAKISKINGILIPLTGLRDLTEEAFKKLGIKFSPSTAEDDYNSGRSTQIPTGLMIGVKQRVAREITFNGRYMSYEQISG